MNNLIKKEKICGFYVSNMHFTTMILPYIKKKIEEKISVYTFFEFKLNNNIQMLLDGIYASLEEKEKILKIDWSNFERPKYTEIEKKLKNINSFENIILVCGRETYINTVNEAIDKYIEKNQKKLEGKIIKIINCYEANNFNENIKEILDKHDKTINTSGEHEIADVFEGYEKKVG